MSRRRSIEVDIDLEDFDDDDIIDELIARLPIWKHKPREQDLHRLKEALTVKCGINTATSLDEKRFHELAIELSKTKTWNQLINKLEH